MIHVCLIFFFETPSRGFAGLYDWLLDFLMAGVGAVLSVLTNLLKRGPAKSVHVQDGPYLIIMERSQFHIMPGLRLIRKSNITNRFVCQQTAV